MSREMVLLDTGTKAHPGKLHEHFLHKAWDQRVSVLVLSNEKGRLSLVLDHYDNGQEMLNSLYKVRADQSNRHLGTHRVVGVQSFNGTRYGNVPNRTLTAKVQK